MRLSKHIFRSQKLQKWLKHKAQFFLECLEFNLDCKKAIRNSKKLNSFSGKSTSVGGGKFSLLVQEYS